VGGGERGVVDFGKLFTETNYEQKFSLGEFRVRYDTICYFHVRSKADINISQLRGFQPVVRGLPGVRGQLPRGSRATPGRRTGDPSHFN